MGASVGIRPKADGENIILTDTHRDLVDDVTATTDEFGTVLGEGINEIAATAKSANDSAGELASRVKSLEESVARSASEQHTHEIHDIETLKDELEKRPPIDHAALTPVIGTGWQNCTRKGAVYLAFGPRRVTVTATGVEGVAVVDFGRAGTPHFRALAYDGVATVAAIVTNRTVVRTLNPKANAEVTATIERIPAAT